MTLSTTTADSPNCVVRCLEHQLAATSLAGMSAKGEQEEPHEYNDAVGYNNNNNNNNASSSPIKQDEDTTTATATAATTVVTLRTPLKDVRNMIFQLTALTGALSTLFLQNMPLDHEHEHDNNNGTTSLTTTTTTPQPVVDGMAQLLRQLVELSAALSVDLGRACLNKIALNNRKYPVELCKGKAGKYTQYSQATGITKTEGQSTATAAVHTTTRTNNNDNNSNDKSDDWRRHFLDAPWTRIAAETRQFAVRREWERYHQPRNLLLALTGELGELAELFQWKGDAGGDADDNNDCTTMSVTEHDKVGQELADVTIYLCRLADVCGVALADETKRRITME